MQTFNFPSHIRLKTLTLATLLACAALPCQAGFSVSGTQLLDGNGTPFIIRGINHAHTWYSSTTTQAIDDIASVKANTMRVVLSSGDRWNRTSANEVASIIQQLKDHKMIAVLEVHDTTGYGEDSAASTLDSAVDYWLSIADVLQGQEDYVIINIGNEPIGNNVDPSIWINDHISAIKRLRDAGLTHTLMVDAPNWGQDWKQDMLHNAKTVAAADTLKNTVFSVHMYGVYPDANSVTSYVNQFLTDNKLPLVIGEFAADDPSNNTKLPAETVMQLSEQKGIGYMGWSWAGNSGSPYSSLIDMTVNFELSNLTPWGDLLINGENGLRATAKPATVFAASGDSSDDSNAGQGDDNDGGSDDSGSDAGDTTDSGVTCTVTTTNIWSNGYQLEVNVTNDSDAAIKGWQVNLNYTQVPQLSNFWNADLTVDGLVVHAVDAGWNAGLSQGASTSFGVQGMYSGTYAAPTCDVL